MVVVTGRVVGVELIVVIKDVTGQVVVVILGTLLSVIPVQ